MILRPHTSDQANWKQIFEDKEYEPAMQLLLNLFPSTHPVRIIDAGAYIGLATLYFIQTFKNANIIAIELDTENFKALSHNLAHRDIMRQVLPIHGALWNNSADLLTVRTDQRDKKHWSHYAVVADQATPENQCKPAFTLGDLMGMRSWQGCDLIKMDIEGAERLIFSDEVEAAWILKRTKVLAIEIHGDMEAGLDRRLQTYFDANGFKWFVKYETTFAYNAELITDF
jgi:FkbM family methyltransferase